MAWKSICNPEEKKKLNLDHQQSSHADAQLHRADEVVRVRIPETYQWLIVPEHPDPKVPIEWRDLKLAGQEPLALRATARLREDDLLVPRLAATRLRMAMDSVPLWRGDHVRIKQLAEDFARYIYLSRLTDSNVLVDSIEEGVQLLSWQTETFAYADSFDEATGFTEVCGPASRFRSSLIAVTECW